eukprot:COSAG06_NODE_14056_length_1194_cov_0.916895_2_plen_123_part_00
MYYLAKAKIEVLCKKYPDLKHALDEHAEDYEKMQSQGLAQAAAKDGFKKYHPPLAVVDVQGLQVSFALARATHFSPTQVTSFIIVRRVKVEDDVDGEVAVDEDLKVIVELARLCLLIEAQSP